jgi:DNA-directed RNA polymerase specialized sigma24 family protein
MDDLMQEARLSLWVHRDNLIKESYVQMQVWGAVKDEAKKERVHHGILRAEMPVHVADVVTTPEEPETLHQEVLRMRSEGFTTSAIGDVVGMCRTQVMATLRQARKAA